jgi:hemerythrin-like domain-containing protein
MCTYCGCETDPAIAALAKDHDDMGDLASRIGAALDAGDRAKASELMAELVKLFERHSAVAEAGLFHQLEQAGEGTEALIELRADHCRLRELLDNGGPTSMQPEVLRGFLSHLTQHANSVDTDLCPFARQVLPDDRWEEMTNLLPRAAAHQVTDGL